jgi:hypothetical protein
MKFLRDVDVQATAVDQFGCDIGAVVEHFQAGQTMDVFLKNGPSTDTVCVEYQSGRSLIDEKLRRAVLNRVDVEFSIFTDVAIR